jgi:hypothetical protein
MVFGTVPKVGLCFGSTGTASGYIGWQASAPLRHIQCGVPMADDEEPSRAGSRSPCDVAMTVNQSKLEMDYLSRNARMI